MPIRIPDELPAKRELKKEGIITLAKTSGEDEKNDSLEIGILNLMPNKQVTETQLLRLLNNISFQVNITLCFPHGHEPKNCGKEHLSNFYESSEIVRRKKLDGLIITGAPVEHLDFREVLYWEELKRIFEWTRENVTSTLHICWGAIAGACYHYGIEKENYGEKLFGVFPHNLCNSQNPLMFGLNESFNIPHSRYAGLVESDISQNTEIETLAFSPIAGNTIFTSRGNKQIFITGHLEYDDFSLKEEYKRDINYGLTPDVPRNYYPHDNINNIPNQTWKNSALIFFSNWLNIIHQKTSSQRR